MKRSACTLLLLVCMVALLGCRTASPFAKDGIPKQCYRVGGGVELYYRAPVTGTIWFVEDNSRTIISSKSLEPGKVFSESVDPRSEGWREDLETLGIYPSDARFSLYFVPSRWTGDDIR